jgi:hypothetical protein
MCSAAGVTEEAGGIKNGMWKAPLPPADSLPNNESSFSSIAKGSR